MCVFLGVAGAPDTVPAEAKLARGHGKPQTDTSLFFTDILTGHLGNNGSQPLRQQHDQRAADSQPISWVNCDHSQSNSLYSQQLVSPGSQLHIAPIYYTFQAPYSPPAHHCCENKQQESEVTKCIQETVQHCIPADNDSLTVSSETAQNESSESETWICYSDVIV